MRIYSVEDPDARLAIAGALSSLLPGVSLVPHAQSADYTFMIAFADDEPDDALADATALAILSRYDLPMANRAVLAVDALGVRSSSFADVVAFLRKMSGIAEQAGLDAVLLTGLGVAHPGLIQALADLGRLDDHPIGEVRPRMMRRSSAGLWSPFAGGPIPDRVFQAGPCVRIVTEDVQLDTGGVLYEGADRLYRGEGQLTCANWDCASPDALAGHLRRHGFAARSPAAFGGTVGEQILQQGYVPQGTVSLSASFDVCAYYATHRHTRPGGVVFTIDADRLRARGPIWDSYATLVRQCDWFFHQELETLTMIVGALGVKEGGRFLALCYARTRESCEFPSGFSAIDWDAYIDGGLARLREAGIQPEQVESLHDAFETYWLRALGLMMAEDVIHFEGGVEERRLGVLGYQHAFREVKDRLATEPLKPPDPGWDLTSFGFIAKTCRDREYFTTGPVAPDAIIAATIVD